MLVGQLVIAILVYSDLLVLLAAQLPLALPRKAARIWLGVQLLATAAYCATLWRDPGFEVASGPERAAYPVAFALTTLLLLAWQGLAYAIGLIAVTESDARRTAESVTRELLATRPILATAARSAERLRIARELHDTLGHHLTVLTVQLEIAATESGAPVGDSIRRAQQVSRLLLADVREVVHEMRAENSEDLLAAITERAVGSLQGADVDPPAESLTRRETQVLRRMAGGYSNRQIADALGASEGTIKNHATNMFQKLGVGDRTRAVLKAIELGYL